MPKGGYGRPYRTPIDPPLPKYSYSDFISILESKSQLYELHTHLLGMGNAGFWIDTILCDRKIMPTNEMFLKKDSEFPETLCRLIWKKNYGSGFVNAKESANFIKYLRKSKDIPWDTAEKRKKVEDDIKDQFKDLYLTFWSLIEDEKFNKEQHHRVMNFGKHFSYDVVLTLNDLAKGLNVDLDNGDDIAQMKIAEKLGIYLSEDTESIEFGHWIIFNARKQLFEIVYGIRVEDLRKLITIDITSPNEAKKNAHAHIVNAFSMCDAQGTPARHVDFHNFRGAFTPEFYPRRFALKDSIYSQRLDVLAALIYHVLKRYQTCFPPVKYCEFSVGVGDLSSPWVFDVLRSFPAQPPITNPNRSQPTEESSSFLQCVRAKSFPYLQVACDLSNNVTYKFLAGFDRMKVQSSLFKDQNGAMRLLNDSPHTAILLMRKEIWNSKELSEKSEELSRKSEESEALRKESESLRRESEEFRKQDEELCQNQESEKSYQERKELCQKWGKLHRKWEELNEKREKLNQQWEELNKKKEELRQKVEELSQKNQLFKCEPKESEEKPETNLGKLEKLKKEASKIACFYEWVVGIDLFGDELGYPYCPFVTHPFITYIKDIRKKNPNFGVRVHCGENVQYAEADAPAYRSFIAHMYIVFCCLRYLRCELDCGIRIGHGIGFERILGESKRPIEHRKSSVLRAEMRHQAPKLFENIAFEVNITSNEYLLGDSLRQGNIAQTHCLDALLKLEAPIILSTDDDGIWPIDRCSSVHPGHHSLTAEYCRAISSSLFKEPKDLEKLLENSEKFCFSKIVGNLPRVPYDLSKEDVKINTIILHPDLVKHILRRLEYIHKQKKQSAQGNVEEPAISHTLTEEGPNGPFYTKYRLYYLPISDSYNNNDKTQWGAKYRSIAQVAYICFCKQNGEIIPPKFDESHEYYCLFEDDKNGEILEYISNRWEKIDQEFMNLYTNNRSRNYRYVSIKPPKPSLNSNETSEDRGVSIVTPVPNSDQPYPGIDFLAGQEDKGKQRIEIYVDHMNIDPKDPVWKDISAQTGLNDLDVTYYTNRDKNKFIYIKCDTKFQLSFNPRSKQRDRDTKNYLYALCEYAGAATAALRLVAKYITSDSQNLPETKIYSPDANHQPAETQGQNQTNELPYEDLSRRIIDSNASSNKP